MAYILLRNFLKPLDLEIAFANYNTCLSCPVYHLAMGGKQKQSQRTKNNARVSVLIDDSVFEGCP